MTRITSDNRFILVFVYLVLLSRRRRTGSPLRYNMTVIISFRRSLRQSRVGWDCCGWIELSAQWSTCTSHGCVCQRSRVCLARGLQGRRLGTERRQHALLAELRRRVPPFIFLLHFHHAPFVACRLLADPKSIACLDARSPLGHGGWRKHSSSLLAKTQGICRSLSRRVHPQMTRHLIPWWWLAAVACRRYLWRDVR